MVVFTCTHCGDSLQKPKVEKHYQTVCRTIKSLTCVDCLKDFRDEEYASHIKCITEEERYAAKGANPKQVVKKGEVKQESWTELIKNVVENAKNVAGAPRRVLNVMANSVNVPRKKNKFINFIKSSTGGKLKNEDIEVVWGMIEQYKATQNGDADSINGAEQLPKPEDTIDELVKGKKKRKSKEAQEAIETTETNEDTTVQTTKSKKKKHKSEDVAEAIATETNEDTTVQTTKSKKKKHKSEDVAEAIETETNEETVQTEGKSKKKKRKSKHADENGEANDGTNTEILTTKRKSEDDQIVEVKKKRKSKALETPETNDDTVTAEHKSKKKRKSKNADEANNIAMADIPNVNGKSEGEATNGEVVAVKKKHKSKDVLEPNETTEINDDTVQTGEGKSKKKKRKSKNCEDVGTNDQIVEAKKKRKSKDVSQLIEATEMNEDLVQPTEVKSKKKKQKTLGVAN